MQSSKAVLYFLAGAAIGGAVGLLFAPDKGSETRRRISEKGSDLTDSIKERINDMKEGVRRKISGANEEDVEENSYS
jgi:gas vesicle protein